MQKTAEPKRKTAKPKRKTSKSKEALKQQATSQEDISLIQLNESILKQAQERFSHCLFELETGFNYHCSSKLHARVLQYLPISFSLETQTIGIKFGQDIFYLMINPQWFLGLKTLEAQIQALLHSEQHLFFMHPTREAYLGLMEGAYSLELFRTCAEIEVLTRLPKKDFSLSCLQLSAQRVKVLQSLKSVSAESLYHELKSHWLTEQKGSKSHQKDAQLKAKLDLVKALNQTQDCCDRSLWTIQGGPQKVRMFRAELDRILLMARESLNIEDLKTLASDDRKRIEQINQDYQLNQGGLDLSQQTKLQKQAEAEVDRVILQMQIQDSFFGTYLAGCIRQVSTMVPTAGVAIRRDHIALVVNPHFFMKQLKDLAERAAVLKHEALHIMLKHVIMIRSDKFTNKQLYNIAADLEVNQYIGRPWSLPKDAVTLDSFPTLKLPRHEVAEVYYKLLLEHKNEAPCQTTVEEITQRKTPSSDHRAWNDEGSAPSNEAEDNEASSSLMSPLNLPDELVKAQEFDIEKQLKRAVDQTPSRQHGSIPGKILSLLEAWEKARKSPVNWKRELKLFMSLSRRATRTHTNRKPNTRHFIRQHLALSTQKLTADALQVLVNTKPKLLPKITWRQLSKALQQEALTLNPELKGLKATSLVPWLKLPRLIIHKLQEEQAQLAWPDWSALDDSQLKQIKVLRTPLSTKVLPLDLYLLLAKEAPKRLPKLKWSDFDSEYLKQLFARFQYLSKMKKLAWPMLPAQAIAELYQSKPELFTLSWSDVPPQLLAQNNLYHFTGKEAFRIDRVITKTQPGTKRRFKRNKILVIIDTSGSVSNDDIKQLFDHIDGMRSEGIEVHVLQVDTKVQLYYPYVGKRPTAGRGGTRFDPAFEWVCQARTKGVLTPTYDRRTSSIKEQLIRLDVDGVIYLTDGHAQTPTVNPKCRVLWALTSHGSSDRALKDWVYTTKIMTLPETVEV